MKACLPILLLLVEIVTATPCGADTYYSTGSIRDDTTEFLKVFDVQSLEFERIVKEQNEVWVLAEVEPSPKSDRLEGLTVDPVSHKSSVVPGQKPVTVFDGSLHVRAVLSGKTDVKNLPYRLEVESQITPDGSLIGTTVDETYLSFQTPNLVIARLNLEKAKPSKNSNPIEVKSGLFYLMPVEWQQSIAPAFDYYRANAALFVDEDARKNQVKLNQLLEGDNPLLVVAACRALVRGGALNGRLIQGVLTRSKGYLQAAVTAVMLIDAPRTPYNSYAAEEEQLKELRDPTLSEALLNNAASVALVSYDSKDSSQLEGLALGVWVAADILYGDMQTHLPRYYARIEKLTSLLFPMQEKLNTWGVKTQSDRNLRSYLIEMRIPDRMATQAPPAK